MVYFKIYNARWMTLLLTFKDIQKEKLGPQGNTIGIKAYALFITDPDSISGTKFACSNHSGRLLPKKENLGRRIGRSVLFKNNLREPLG